MVHAPGRWQYLLQPEYWHNKNPGLEPGAVVSCCAFRHLKRIDFRLELKKPDSHFC